MAFFGSKALRMPAIRPNGRAAISAGIEGMTKGIAPTEITASSAMRKGKFGSSRKLGRGETYMAPPQYR
ncbi:hypothetical protein ACFOHY_11840 [Rhizobium rosettiformans]|uniref:hypothetical protein n=1 Tax=Rhizobium rosettiformans TaxID=1368430 RepID=UPI0036078B28